MPLVSQVKTHSKSQSEAKVMATDNVLCETEDVPSISPTHKVAVSAKSNMDSSEGEPLGTLRMELLASLAVVHQKLDAFLEREKELERSIEFQAQKVNEVEKEAYGNRAEIKSIKKDFGDMQKSVTSVQDEVIAMQHYSRAYNLCFSGVKECKGENCMEIIKALLKEKLKMGKEVDTEVARRVGKVDGKKDRHIIPKFAKRIERDAVLRQGKQNLREVKEYVIEDLCPSDFKKKTELKPVMQVAYEKGQKVKFQKGKLYTDGKIYMLN